MPVAKGEVAMDTNVRRGMAPLFAGLACLVVCGTVADAATPAKALPEPVHSAHGLLTSTASMLEGVRVFKGIPFAAPPVGKLRWQPAQPAARWQGVRAADHFGATCIQPHQAGRTPNNRSVDLPDSPPMSEDCLFLNLWRPAATTRASLPVMVWIHGGAYTEGAGSTPLYDGSVLASKGVIVVTFNYRLGAFGFLAHPELTAESRHHASGNYALTDVLATLQWVKDNIAAFGGDPGRVTIFGESAGAAMVSALVATPAAKGLFQRAISQSGAWMGLALGPMRTRESAEQQTVKAAAELGITSLARLRALPADDVATKLPHQGMIVDGWVIPEDLSLTFAQNRQNRVNVLAGSNRDEGSFAGGPPEATRDFTENLAWITRLYAAQHRKAGAHAWVFQFMHEPPYPPGVRNLGVCHTCEIPYVFGNLAAPRLFPDLSSPELAVASTADRRAAEMTMGYWVNFARTGKPNGPGLPEWPEHGSDDPSPVMHLGPQPAVGEPLGSERGAQFSEQYDRLMELLGAAR
jgi:para-nitrobenzyl esterase